MVLTLATSEEVSVTDSAWLTLSDDGTATCAENQSTATALAFDHTPQATQATADLLNSSLVLAKSAIVDTAGNDLVVT